MGVGKYLTYSAGSGGAGWNSSGTSVATVSGITN